MADNDPEQPGAAKSAEDRKAAAALSKLDARDDSDASAAAHRQVDSDAVKNAVGALGGGAAAAGGTGAGAGGGADGAKAAAKKVKVDPADVTLLVDELGMTKAKATQLLKAHDGDAVRAMRAFVQPAF